MIVYQDRRIVVAEKPCGVLSTDEPGGMPELLRQELGEPKRCSRSRSGTALFKKNTSPSSTAAPSSRRDCSPTI